MDEKTFIMDILELPFVEGHLIYDVVSVLT